jgi:hypothetical protein
MLKMKRPEKKARTNRMRERDAYIVALLESVRFSSARENRNLTNSSVSCSLRSAQTFRFGARKQAFDVCGVGGRVSLKNGSEMKKRNDKRTRPVDTITQDFFEEVIAATCTESDGLYDHKRRYGFLISEANDPWVAYHDTKPLAKFPLRLWRCRLGQLLQLQRSLSSRVCP